MRVRSVVFQEADLGEGKGRQASFLPLGTAGADSQIGKPPLT